MTVQFTVYAKPEPQGSSRAFMVKGRPVITTTNKNLKSFRQQVTLTAIQAMHSIQATRIDRSVPVLLNAHFLFARPKSKSKKASCVVKPDLDKLVRSIGDSLSGICYEDDSQITGIIAFKNYGLPERVEIKVTPLKGEPCAQS